MGGVRTNKDGAAYGLKGLFAAGEAVCWDLHGFNRLGGNSLAETIVVGRIVGGKVVEFLEGYDVTFDTALIKTSITRERERIDQLVASNTIHWIPIRFPIRTHYKPVLWFVRPKMKMGCVF